MLFITDYATLFVIYWVAVQCYWFATNERLHYSPFHIFSNYFPSASLCCFFSFIFLFGTLFPLKLKIFFSDFYKWYHFVERQRKKQNSVIFVCVWGKNKLHDFVLRQLNSSLNTKKSTAAILFYFTLFWFEFGDMMEPNKKRTPKDFELQQKKKRQCSEKVCVQK